MSRTAVVIGAGVNGLAAAHMLARGGWTVRVLERAAAAGAGLDTGWVPPAVLAATGLTAQDVEMVKPTPWLSLPLPEGGRLELTNDVRQSAEAIRAVSPHDAAAWPEFCARMHALAGFLGSLYSSPPPDVETTKVGELLNLAATGLRARRLGRQGMIDLLRVLPMSAWELLDDWFENDALKGGLAAGAVMHQFQGPRGGGTAFTLLHHAVGAGPGSFRPPLSNLSSVLAKRPGIALRYGATVTRVRIGGGRATGVVLEGGEEIAADLVLSSADPRATLLGMVDATWLEPEFVRAIRNVKCRGIVAHVTLTGGVANDVRAITIAPSVTYVEKAYDDAKYDRVSAAPVVEVQVEGASVVARVQYVPRAPAGGPWDDAQRRALGQAVHALLVQHEQAFAKFAVARVETPADFETERGLTGGHLYHGELTLDQILFMRPVAGWGRYATPVKDLYLCGAGTHPGGAIAGAAGINAVREVV